MPTNLLKVANHCWRSFPILCSSSFWLKWKWKWKSNPTLTWLNRNGESLYVTVNRQICAYVVIYAKAFPGSVLYVEDWPIVYCRITWVTFYQTALTKKFYHQKQISYFLCTKHQKSFKSYKRRGELCLYSITSDTLHSQCWLVYRRHLSTLELLSKLKTYKG